MRYDHQIHEAATDVLPDVFPWVSFLSPDERQQFLAELVGTIRAAESIDNPAPVALVIDSWRHTAEVLADPKLAAALLAPSDGDHGAVPSIRSK